MVIYSRLEVRSVIVISVASVTPPPPARVDGTGRPDRRLAELVGIVAYFAERHSGGVDELWLDCRRRSG